MDKLIYGVSAVSSCKSFYGVDGDQGYGYMGVVGVNLSMVYLVGTLGYGFTWVVGVNLSMAEVVEAPGYTGIV